MDKESLDELISILEEISSLLKKQYQKAKEADRKKIYEDQAATELTIETIQRLKEELREDLNDIEAHKNKQLVESWRMTFTKRKIALQTGL